MTAPTMAPDFIAIKGRQQQAWATGDYGMVGVTLVIMAEQLCEAMDLRAGQRVLDMASGNGNAALAAARRFCAATSTDYVPALLERGKERAAAEHLDLTFQEADVENLPFADGSFDAVLSVVGAMFAPDQERTAGEMLRVVRPGGKVGMANWTPDGFVGQMFRVIGKYAPPPAGLKPPALWGTEERLRELFGDHVSALTATRRAYIFHARTADDWVAYFWAHYGPITKAFDGQDAAGKDALAADLANLLLHFNRSDDATLVVPSDYLEVVAIKK
ncbi:MAG: class I SAM-dependent methyltransferase [Thermomicrobiales bacterium]